MAWDKEKPAGGDEVATVDNSIRTNNAALEAAVNEEHSFATGGVQTGEHREGSAVLYRDHDADVLVLDCRAGRAALAKDTHRLYVGNDAANWQQESPKHVTALAGATVNPEAALAEQAAWTAVPGFAAATEFTPSGDAASTCDLLIMCSIVARCETDGGQLHFVLYLNGASVTAATNGLACIAYSQGGDALERVETITMVWLAAGVVKGAGSGAGGAIQVQPRYKTTAGASGAMPAQFRPVLTIVEI